MFPNNAGCAYIPIPDTIDATTGGAVRCEGKTMTGDLLLDIPPSVLACQGAAPPWYVVNAWSK